MTSIRVVLLLLLTTLPAYAHYEDPKGCAETIAAVREGQHEWEIAYQGISEDNRDYIIRYRATDNHLIVEEHYILYPPAQWPSPEEPVYSDQVLSEWMDHDGDGVYSEWYLFPRGQSRCEDALHFIWDNDLQTYTLYATGKERT